MERTFFVSIYLAQCASDACEIGLFKSPALKISILDEKETFSKKNFPFWEENLSFENNKLLISNV